MADRILLKLYHGTTTKIPFLRKGSWVSTSPSEAWIYATILSRTPLAEESPHLIEVSVDDWSSEVELGPEVINGALLNDVHHIRFLSPEEIETLLAGSPVARLRYVREVIDIRPLLRKPDE